MLWKKTHFLSKLKADFYIFLTIAFYTGDETVKTVKRYLMICKAKNEISLQVQEIYSIYIPYNRL